MVVCLVNNLNDFKKLKLKCHRDVLAFVDEAYRSCWEKEKRLALLSLVWFLPLLAYTSPHVHKHDSAHRYVNEN